ncbi:MAG: CBS domain-containing protein, partial [Nitrosopumilus sp.]|nr:CBS domain-containing protein [Nitrosopumilus sp.]NNL37909.1 CBS domain-containing protein [Nitrosopumilus sp.]
MDPKKLKLTELITKPITVKPNTSLIKTRQTLLEKKVKRVVVVDGKIPIGVITEKDIARKIYQLGTTPIKTVKAKDFKQRKLFTLTSKN